MGKKNGYGDDGSVTRVWMSQMGMKDEYGGVWNEGLDVSIERWSVGMKRMGMKDIWGLVQGYGRL